MDHTKEILKAASNYCDLTGLSRATVATKVMNDGKFFDRIEGGGGFTIQTYQKVKRWFQENSPKQISKSKQSHKENAAECNTQIT